MTRTRWRATALLMALALGLALTGGVIAGDEPAHPAHIHEGLCPAPTDIIATLDDVSAAYLTDGEPSAGALPVGAASALPIGASTTTVPLSLSDLVSADHSIVIHVSAADMGTCLVCGDVGGLIMGEADLPIGLGPVNGSGFAGIAWITDGGDGSTLVRLFLTRPDARSTGPIGSPDPSRGEPQASFVLDSESVIP